MGPEHNSLCWPDSSSSTHFLLALHYFWPPSARPSLSPSPVLYPHVLSPSQLFKWVSDPSFSTIQASWFIHFFWYHVILRLNPFPFFIFFSHWATMTLSDHPSPSCSGAGHNQQDQLGGSPISSDSRLDCLMHTLLRALKKVACRDRRPVKWRWWNLTTKTLSSSIRLATRYKKEVKHEIAEGPDEKKQESKKS